MHSRTLHSVVSPVRGLSWVLGHVEYVMDSAPIWVPPSNPLDPPQIIMGGVQMVCLPVSMGLGDVL